MKNSFLNHRSSLGVPPEFFGATGVGNDAAALNLWLAADIFKRVGAEQFYSFSSAVTIPNGTVIEGTLNLIWTGAGSVPVMTIGNDCEIQNLWISTPATTGNSMTIGTGYKGESLVASGFGNSGAGFLTIADTAGLDLDLLESTGGFQRAFTIGNDSGWSSGGRVGMLRVRDYTRGVALNYLDGFRLEGYDIAGRNALAANSPGHNGILAAGLRNCLFGPGSIQGAGEHLFRLGGSADRGASRNNKFGRITMDGPGGSFIKINANAIANDFQFAGVDAVGRFASVPGGNRELFRLSHCRNFVFGPSRLVVGEGSAYSAQDALALNDVTGVVVQGLHVEGLGQSVVDFASGQDIDETLGNGDVRDITIGSLTGEDLTSRTMVRFAMASGFEAAGLNISGVDYFSDGPLFAANGATVVDGPCSISGRFRKTDLTTLPATTNLPLNMVLDLEIGQRRIKNVGGALKFVDVVTPDLFSGATDDARLTAFFARLMATGAHGVMSGEYRTTIDFPITEPISLDALGAVIYQTVWPFGFLQLRAGSGGSRISNVHVVEDLTVARPAIVGNPRYRGYSEAQRHCALWVESGENVIHNISSEGMVSTTCLRGPVVWYPAGAGHTGADTDPNTAFDYSSFAENNRVTETHGKTQDFTITGHQQRNPFIHGFSLRDVVDTTGNPPHVTYMRSNGTGVTAGYIVGGHISGGHCYHSPDGVAHKFHDALGTSFSDLSAYDASGVSNFIDCLECSWANLTGSNLAGDNTQDRYAHNFEGCTGRIIGLHMDGVDSNTIGLLELFDGKVASDLWVMGATATTDFRTGNGVTEALIRAADTSKLNIRGADYKALGNDPRFMFVTAGTGQITASDISCVGTTALANAAGGPIHMNYDEMQMLGTPLTNSGTVTTSIAERTLRRQALTPPSLYGTTTAGTHGHTVRRCWIERTGNRVNLNIICTVDGAFGGTGNVRLGPLPYAVADDAGTTLLDHRPLITTADNITVPGGSFLCAALIDGTNYIGLQTLNGITRANLAHTALGANASFHVQISYYTTDPF